MFVLKWRLSYVRTDEKFYFGFVTRNVSFVVSIVLGCDTWKKGEITIMETLLWFKYQHNV